jgi:hypothetical protein
MCQSGISHVRHVLYAHLCWALELRPQYHQRYRHCRASQTVPIWYASIWSLGGVYECLAPFPNVLNSLHLICPKCRFCRCGRETDVKYKANELLRASRACCVLGENGTAPPACLRTMPCHGADSSTCIGNITIIVFHVVSSLSSSLVPRTRPLSGVLSRTA